MNMLDIRGAGEGLLALLALGFMALVIACVWFYATWRVIRAGRRGASGAPDVSPQPPPRVAGIYACSAAGLASAATLTLAGLWLLGVWRITSGPAETGPEWPIHQPAQAMKAAYVAGVAGVVGLGSAAGFVLLRRQGRVPPPRGTSA